MIVVGTYGEGETQVRVAMFVDVGLLISRPLWLPSVLGLEHKPICCAFCCVLAVKEMPVSLPFHLSSALAVAEQEHTPIHHVMLSSTPQKIPK
ncbi:hypothetical protein ONE63_009594 [Megalurothrips usitatus]|uniref:Uncharacterized protein n=1 Tax=Megalurothrips usitatus TaxID=439358 RepID=A0AAV7XRY4_9NEOP|nr:hypothetical protein ONE63_009594 [Megalurothrips usitatus]